MFKTLTLISALTSVALAQSSTSSAAAGASSPNSLIPSGITSTCSSFLNALNSDPSLSSCLGALTTATSSFAPGSSASLSSATVTSSLDSLCSDSVSGACPESLIRGKITDFYTACTSELTTAKNPDVIKTYDILYTILPLRTSICSKDDSGSWCVMSSPKSGTKETGSTTLADLLSTLYTKAGAALRRRGSQDAITPNLTTYHNTNLIFLYFNPDLDATALCTTCARQVLTAYMTFESNVAYAPGLSSSYLLDKQTALLDAVKSKCPAGFLSGAVQAAGGLSAGVFSSAAQATIHSERQAMTIFAMGAATMVISYIF